MTKQQILEEVQNLPAEDRFDLAVEIWETVDVHDVELSAEMRSELDRRIAEDDADSTPAEPWDVVREKLLLGEV